MKANTPNVPDQMARDEALLPNRSFIVQAPAGSGKTGLLIQRFLVLLAYSEEVPEECLAITFTRKAAAEMRDRILFALQNAKEGSEPLDPFHRKTWELAQKVLARDEHLGWNLLQNPNRLKIQTIDSFCATLTRQMPIMSQFGAQPRVVDNPKLLYQTASRNLLKRLETNDSWSSAVATLLAHLDNNLGMAERLLADLLPHRDQWLPYIGWTHSIDQSRERLEAGLQTVIRETLLNLHTTIPPRFEEIRELAQFAAKQLKLLNKESLIQHCDLLYDHRRKPELSDLPFWLGFSELLLTKEYHWRKTVTEVQGFKAPSSAVNKEEKLFLQNIKSKMNECLSYLENFPQFRENLQKLSECPPNRYDDKQWEMVLALVQLLPLLTAELDLVFQESAEVDFLEITLRALKALGETEAPSDLALSLDYRICHILVDEFQDTSITQFHLLEKLTAGWQQNDGRTLFLVGDPMQSIYRFRQAEVGLFIRAKLQGVGQIELKTLTLTTNFRSDPSLVEWTNTFFEKKFPLQDDITRSAIAFSPSISVRLPDAVAVAELQTITLETESAQIVSLIQSIKEEDPKGSIALLVRSRTHLQKILPALQRAEIAYQGIQLELLGNRPSVQDLLALTKALLHLGDRIAWLSILRAPWAQLSLGDLLIIANKDPSLPIWTALDSYRTLPGLSSLAKDRLNRIVPVLREALSQSYRFNLRQWVMQTWLALGGGEHLYDHGCLQDILAFFSVLDEEKSYDFRELGVLDQRIEALFAKPELTDPDALQIMTIHKAKGLEFDTVILPGLGRKSLSDPSRLLLWEERISYLKDNYLILAPIKPVGSKHDPIYAFLKNEEAIRAEHEAMRLWYVAATRARKRLYCLIHEN